MIEITLSPEQEIDAAQIGVARRVNAIRRSLVSRHRFGSRWEADIEGALAEAAAALALDLPWLGRDYFVGEGNPMPAGDIGTQTEVRWTKSREPLLRIDPRDDLDRPYVLVSGFAPHFVIHGYALGRDVLEHGRAEEYPERTVYTARAQDLRSVERGVAA